MPDLHVYGAGQKDAKVKLAAGTTFDIEAIIEVSGDPQQETVEVKGDDTLKTTFVFSQTENVTIRANAISFDVLQAITGNTYGSSAVGSEIPLGTVSEQNPPFIELQSFVLAKRADNVATTIEKIFHKVQIYTIKINSSNGNEFSVEMTGKAYQTATDIAGAALTPARIATIKEATNI